MGGEGILRLVLNEVKDLDEYIIPFGPFNEHFLNPPQSPFTKGGSRFPPLAKGIPLCLLFTT